MNKKVAYLAFAGALLASAGANAATDTQNMAVSATISASCGLAVNPLAFGSLASTAADTDAATTITVTCSTDSPYNVGMDYGANAGGGFQRRMAAGANQLNYEVYIDAGRTAAFGPVSTYGALDNYNSPATGNDIARIIDIYGRIPAQSTPPSGAYTDTLAVTLNY